MASFTPKLKDRLKELGAEFYRQGNGDHEIWWNPKNGKKTIVDGNIKSRHTANKSLKDLGFKKHF